MKMILLLELCYGVWFAVGLALILLALSDLVFGKRTDWRLAVRRIWLSILWPFALLTARGRRQLFIGFRSTQLGDKK